MRGMVAVILMALFAGCAQPKIPVALLTKLNAGSIIGTSEIAAVKEFERTHPESLIQVVPIDDGWDPVRTKEAYSLVRKNDIKFLITSHTSTCAVEIVNDINQDKRLAIITGATTTKLSGKDDYILRIIPDANQEQRAIAHKIAELQTKRLLIIRDISNPGYTLPAQEAFLSELNRLYPQILVRSQDIDANQLTLRDLDSIFSSEVYDILYLLIGGYKNIAGNIAQYYYNFQPKTTIVFTPWMNNKELVNTADPALAHAIIPSLFPSRTVDPKIEAYMSSIETNFRLSPTIISLKVYQALELLNLAFNAGARTPLKAKTWLLSQKTIETRLGSISFVAYGESSAEYDFITDIAGEFK
jgi:branched-chain amino acid transport system substrate-binding protein